MKLIACAVAALAVATSVAEAKPVAPKDLPFNNAVADKTAKFLTIALNRNGSPETFNKILGYYKELPQTYRDMVGAVVFILHRNVATMREALKWYDAPDGLLGKSMMGDPNNKMTRGVCIVSLVEDANLYEGPDFLKTTIAHETAHRMDFRVGASSNLAFLEAFFGDVNKNTKEAVIKAGLRHYTTPEEAFAETVAYWLTNDLLNDKYAGELEKMFPNTLADIKSKMNDTNVPYKTRRPTNQDHYVACGAFTPGTMSSSCYDVGSSKLKQTTPPPVDYKSDVEL